MKEKRRHIRTNFTARVKLMHPDLGEKSYATRDIAQGGLFVCVGEEQLNLPVGTEVTVQDDEIMTDPPLVKATVVRVDEDGIALMFGED
jgi:hypothetical protein